MRADEVVNVDVSVETLRQRLRQGKIYDTAKIEQALTNFFYSFSVAAARDDKQFGSRWWTNRQWAKTCFDEWLRLLWWSSVERWH